MALFVLFRVVLGGVVVGFFSPTEAAGVGAFGALMDELAMTRLTAGLVFKLIVALGLDAI